MGLRTPSVRHAANGNVRSGSNAGDADGEGGGDGSDLNDLDDYNDLNDYHDREWHRAEDAAMNERIAEELAKIHARRLAEAEGLLGDDDPSGPVEAEPQNPHPAAAPGCPKRKGRRLRTMIFRTLSCPQGGGRQRAAISGAYSSCSSCADFAAGSPRIHAVRDARVPERITSWFEP